MHLSRRFSVAFAIAIFTITVANAQNADVPTIADQNGCKVYNPMPQEQESIRWDGACIDGFADGSGILDWLIGDRLEERYEGELKLGWAEGEGTYISRNGVRYKGQWKRSQQDGKGTTENPDGSGYQGEWKAGKPHGWGAYRTPTGETIEGEWVDGELKSDSTSRRI